jgi:hypothetical protein
VGDAGFLAIIADVVLEVLSQLRRRRTERKIPHEHLVSAVEF